MSDPQWVPEGRPRREDFDHVAFAVEDALAAAAGLRSTYGATPVAGELVGDFRYLLLDIGTERAGGRLELLEPVGEGFMTRFLARHGQGPHHLTFTVPDLASAVAEARERGLAVTGEDYGHEPWQQAFILPTPATGLVIQLAQTARDYPSRSELHRSRERDVESFPSSRGATDPRWWEGLWEVDQGRSVDWLGVQVVSADLGRLASLLIELLGAEVGDEVDGASRFSWPSGSLWVREGERSGIAGVVTQTPDGRARLLDSLDLIGPT